MIKRTLAKLIFYLVAVVLLTWTASLTVSFVQSVLPNSFWAVPYLALVVFDGGMISWLFVFLSHAQGAIQRATALALCVFDLLGVGLMVVAEIILDGQTWVAAPESLAAIAVWGIGIWTIVNVAGVVLFHLGDPEAQKEMAIQSEKDAIFAGALTDMKSRRIDAQQALSQELGGGIFAELLADVRRDANRNGTPDIMERGAQKPVSNSAYDAPRQDATPRAARQGEPTPDELAEALALIRARQHAAYTNGDRRAEEVNGNGSHP